MPSVKTDGFIIQPIHPGVKRFPPVRLDLDNVPKVGGKDERAFIAFKTIICAGIRNNGGLK